MPLPRSRNTVPVAVPSGIFSVSRARRRRVGHVDLAAERQRREVHRNLAREIVAVALEERMLLDLDDDVEIAGRPAERAGFAFAREPQPLAGRDAGGNLDRQLAQLLDRALRRGTSGTAW